VLILVKLYAGRNQDFAKGGELENGKFL